VIFDTQSVRAAAGVPKTTRGAARQREGVGAQARKHPGTALLDQAAERCEMLHRAIEHWRTAARTTDLPQQQAMTLFHAYTKALPVMYGHTQDPTVLAELLRQAAQLAGERAPAISCRC
jgi:hypothetical protein